MLYHRTADEFVSLTRRPGGHHGDMKDIMYLHAARKGQPDRYRIQDVLNGKGSQEPEGQFLRHFIERTAAGATTETGTFRLHPLNDQ